MLDENQLHPLASMDAPTSNSPFVEENAERIVNDDSPKNYGLLGLNNVSDNQPKSLVLKPENVPIELKAKNQWMLWKATLKSEGGINKVPSNAEGYPADRKNSESWLSFQDALEIYNRGGFSGIGFVVTPETGIKALDFDKCFIEGKFEKIILKNGIELDIEKIINSLGTYAEFSPSETGVRMFCWNETEIGNKNARGENDKGVEIYDHWFVTVTGNKISSTSLLSDCDLKQLYRDIDNSKNNSNKVKKIWTAKELEPTDLNPMQTWNKMFKSACGGKIKDLFEGEFEHHFESQSDADFYLCGQLAFWTRRDAEKMDRMFRQSGLMRDKWSRKLGDSTYGQHTIRNIIENCDRVWCPEKMKRENDANKYYREIEVDEEQEGAQTETNDAELGKNGKPKKEKSGPSAADILIRIIEEKGEFFNDFFQNSYAQITENGKKTLFDLGSVKFKNYLVGEYRKKTGKIISARGAVDAVIATLKSIAFESPARETFIRKAYFDGKLYYDMANEAGQIIEISSEGWKIVDSAPVIFTRPPTMKPQVMPKKGGDISMLRNLINVKDEDFVLVVGWMVGFWLPIGAQEVLHLKSGEGTGKTRTTNTVRDLVDPNQIPSRKAPRKEENIDLAAMNNAVVAFENLSFIPKWMSDSLCTLSTGSGDASRLFYTNGEEYYFKALRPIILNSITDVVKESDLLSRVVMIEPPYLNNNYKKIGKIQKDFEETAPYIFNLFLDSVVLGLKNMPDPDEETDNRMGDLTDWVCACIPALGFTAEQYRKAHKNNKNETKSIPVENSAFALTLESWAREQPCIENKEGERLVYKGTIGRLIEILEIYGDFNTVDANKKTPRDWPQKPADAGRVIQCLKSVLRSRGLEIIDKNKKGKTMVSNGQKHIKIVKVEKEKVESEEEEVVEEEDKRFNFDELDI